MAKDGRVENFGFNQTYPGILLPGVITVTGDR